MAGNPGPSGVWRNMRGNGAGLGKGEPTVTMVKPGTGETGLGDRHEYMCHGPLPQLDDPKSPPYKTWRAPAPPPYTLTLLSKTLHYPLGLGWGMKSRGNGERGCGSPFSLRGISRPSIPGIQGQEPTSQHHDMGKAQRAGTSETRGHYRVSFSFLGKRICLSPCPLPLPYQIGRQQPLSSPVLSAPNLITSPFPHPPLPPLQRPAATRYIRGNTQITHPPTTVNRRRKTKTRQQPAPPFTPASNYVYTSRGGRYKSKT